MIGELRPYPQYKGTGLNWLNSAPAHWEIRRIKTVLQEVDRRSSTGIEPLLSLRMHGGLVDHHASGGKRIPPSALVGYKRVLPGEIVMNRMRASLGLFAVASSDGLVSPDYAVFRQVAQLSVAYAVQLFRTHAMAAVFRLESTGLGTGESGFLRLYSDQFGRLPIPIPPPSEQAAIVRFLNWANGRLERAIRAKRKVIALLNEQKQAIIHRAVTRGLDPAVPLRVSGIPWLGEIPQHWDAVRLKAKVGFQEGPGIMLADFRDSGVPLLRISCLAGDETSLAGCNYLSPSMVREKWRHFAVKPGDYLLSASGSTGAVRRASAEVVGAIPYTGIIRLWPKSNAVDMEYLRLFMSARPFADQISIAKSGVGIEHFGPTHLKRMWICLPPVDEQSQVVLAVRQETVELDVALVRLEREIDLLGEYRTRLVANVVTGKLDVREAAGRLPDEAASDTADDEADLTAEPETADEETPA